MFFFFFPTEMNPKEILYLSDCMIVILTDESQKMKNCISGVCLRYIWSFLILPFVSALVYYASLLCVLSFTYRFLFSSLTSLFFDSPAHLLSIHTFASPVTLSAHIFLCLLLSSFTHILLSFPVPTSLQLPFVPVCQKIASITGCCCITVAIMQIYLLFNVSKSTFFVRVRINLHWVIFIRKGKHTSISNKCFICLRATFLQNHILLVLLLSFVT